MAATLTVTKRSVMGAQRTVTGTVSLNTYATNGVAVTAANLGLSSSVDFLILSPASGYTAEYDYTNKKVLAYRIGAVSAHSHDVKIIGGQAAAGTAATAWYATDILGKEAATDKTIAGADSATKGGVVSAGSVAATTLTEVSNAVDLSAVSFRFFAIGV